MKRLASDPTWLVTLTGDVGRASILPVKRALKVLGVVVAVGALALGFVVGRQWWLRRERAALLQQDALRAPVARPGGRSPEAAALPSPRAACVTGVVVRGHAPESGALVGAARSSGLRPGCPCGAAPGMPGTARVRCDCEAGLQWLLDTLEPGLGTVDGEASATADGAGQFALCGELQARVLWAETSDGALGFALPPASGVFGEAPVVIELRAPQHITGLVVEAGTGVPLAGATVLALSEPAVRSARTQSGHGGRFELVAPGGALALVVGAPGYAPRLVGVSEDVPEVVELSRPTAVFVLVQHDGQPVPDATVTLSHRATVSSGRDGVARFAGVARDGFVPVEARKGRLVGEATLAVLGAEVHGFVELAEGGVVQGTVTRTDGGPLSEVRVVVAGALVDRQEVGADGRFAARPLPAGPVSVRAVAEGCATTERRDLALTTEGLTVALELVCGLTLEGEVVDADGRPVPRAEVELSGPGGKQGVETDSRGAFRAAVVAGPHTLEVSARGYRRAELEVQAPATGVTVVLDAGGSVSGRVTDRAGTPVKGASVMLVPVLFEDLLSESSERRPETSDADGRFSFGGLLPGRFTVMAVHGSGAGHSGEVLLQPGASVDNVAVVLTGLEPVRGTVVDRERRPVVGATVNLEATDEKALLSTLVDALAGGDLTGLVAAMSTDTRTDLEGRFLVRPSTDVALTLEVDHLGFRDHKQAVRPGETVEVVLEREVHRQVKGRVTDARGPLAAFVVSGRALASPDGRFSVEVDEGEETLTLSAPGHASVTRQLAASDDLGDVLLPTSALLTVGVRDEAGAPVVGARLEGEQGGETSGPASGTSTGQDGTGVLKGLAPGPTRVKAARDGFLTAEKQLDLPENGTRLELTLKRARGAIDGLVRGPAGGQGGVSVELGPSGERTLTLGDGTFGFTGLAPGRYTLTANVESRGQGVAVALEEAPVQVLLELAGGTLEGEARLGGSVVVGGMVVAVQGGAPQLPGEGLLSPGPGLLAQVTRAAWAPVRDGRFEVTGLAPGRWSLYLAGLGDLLTEQLGPVLEVSLGPGERKRVELRR